MSTTQTRDERLTRGPLPLRPRRTVAAVLGGWSPSRKIAAVVVIAALIGLFVASGQQNDDRGAPERTEARAGEETSATGSGEAAGADSPSTTRPADAAADSEGSVVIADLPLSTRISDTSGLRDGDTVHLEVTAEDRSSIFGVEIRTCIANPVVRVDADMLPTEGGQCAAEALSAKADGYLKQAGEPPYESLDVAYRVGVGTDRYRTSDGSTASVSCGARSPCSLVVKFQVPHGFGYRVFPISFA